MSGFEFVNTIDYGLKDERYTSNLVPYCSQEVIVMMKNMGICLIWVLEKKKEGWLNSLILRLN